MGKYVSAIVLLLSFFFLSPSHVSAHAGQEHVIADYNVATLQDPLSPFVGEKVKVTFTVTDDKGQPVRDVKGDLVIKKIVVQQFTDQTSNQEQKEIYKTMGRTNQDGEVAVEYTFTNEGLYDAEFIWGKNIEQESAGLEIFARNPTSYFLPQELMKRIWLFIGIGFIGIVVGAAGTFLLLTTTLHPKK